MVKSKTVYVCNDCGAEHTQWQGQCVACKVWNSLTKVQLGVSSSPSANANFRREGYAGETSDVKLASLFDFNSKNLENLKNLGVDCLEFTPNPDICRKMQKIALMFPSTVLVLAES